MLLRVVGPEVCETAGCYEYVVIMSVSLSPRYTSVACGRSPHAADWNTNGLICYGASCVVALYDANLLNADPITILSHHRGKINSVKWIQRGTQHPNELISCSGDRTAVIWSKKDETWSASAVLEGHTDGVTYADGLYLDEQCDDSLLIYTASIDSTVRIWERKNGVIKCRQTITLGTGLCLTLRAVLMPDSRRPLLICAFDDDKIYLFTEVDDSGHISDYHKVTVLIGHEDWVRGLDVMTPDSNSILLASSSQDTYIRLWSITRHVEEPEPSGGIRVERKPFTAYGRAWSSKLEAVLAGHEGWVYGVQWHPPRIDSDGTVRPVYKLLSSSLDKTLIVWEPEGASEGVWVEKVRVGEVGGSGLGFYGSKFGPGGTSFMGHGYNGSFHIWRLNEENNQWEPSVTCGGHFGEVVDVRWEPHRGRYLVSVSADQTTRVHAPWSRDPGGRSVQWHEVARPQIHGFDMSSLALVSSTEFVSGAEEKVIRAFRAPHNFVHNFKNITKMELAPGDNTNGPEGASVPSLGLSNKAVFTGGEAGENDDKECDRYFVPVDLTEPPTEETLMQNTLWPEIQKLYGHGYEVFALDACSDGSLVASACKATTAEHAAILLWDTKEWQQVQRLTSHQLTVTQLAFSPDSRGLVSVSRDRRWSLFRRGNDGSTFHLTAASDKTNGAHARIIWCCAWTHDSLSFATGSRDGKICLWGDVGNTKESSLRTYGLRSTPLEIANASVTALAFAPADVAQRKMLAAGFETGRIQIYLWDATEWALALELDNNAAHHLTVKRVSFRPARGEAGAGEGDARTLQLASCGADHLVRIYNLHIADL